MSQRQDIYSEYGVNEAYQVEPLDVGNVYFHDYEPDDDYNEFTTVVPVSYENLNNEDEAVVKRRSYTRTKIPFYGETTHRSQYTWKDPICNRS
ncbi:unnamed protein product, partial [Strongylus vulgaris]